MKILGCYLLYLGFEARISWVAEKHKMVKMHKILIESRLTFIVQANFPNLRRLFVEARTDAEESVYSRNAVSHLVDNITVES